MLYTAKNFLAKLMREAIVFTVARRPVSGEPEWGNDYKESEEK